MLKPCNKENMATFIAALRSGEYKQGNSRLNTNGNEFCCLGVACDISRIGSWVPKVDAYSVDARLYMGEIFYLPPVVQKWLGIDEKNPALTFTDDDGSWHSAEAGTLNDDWKFSFGQLADCFERTYLNEAV